MVTTKPVDDEIRIALLNGLSRPPRSFRKWITDELIIPSGRFAGERFKIETQPVLNLWIDAVDDPQWSDLVFQAVTQMGKTLFGFVSPLLYHTCELAENFVLGVPFGDMASNKWDADILPVMMASPGLRRLLPRRGSGSGGGKIRDSVQLANGAILKIMSAGADDAGKAGFTARCLSITEAARFSAAGTSSTEADPLRQLRGRQRSFPRAERRTYIEGTVTIEDELPWRLRHDSTRSRIVAPCPHCGRYVAPGREDLVGWQDAQSEFQAAALARWRCPKCEAVITEDERRDVVAAAKLAHHGQSVDRSGRVTGSPPQSSRLWFHVTPFFNLLLGPADIGSEEWLGRQIPQDSPDRIQADKELTQFVWSQPYTPPPIDGEIELDRKSIGARMADLPRGVIPADRVFTTLGIDIGETKSWFVLLSSRADGTLHVSDYGDFDVRSDLATPRLAILAALRQFWRVIEAGWQVAGGEIIQPDQVWIDAGHEETAIWQFVRERAKAQRLNQQVIASRGRGETRLGTTRFVAVKKTGNQVRQIDPSGHWYVEWVQRGRVFEVHWDADHGKVVAQHGLTLPQDAAGAINLFAASSRTHERFARHVCAERRRLEHKPGQRPKYKFFRTGANHLLDALAQAVAAQIRLGWEPPEVSIDTPDELGDDPGAERLRAPVVATKPAPAKATAKPQRKLTQEEEDRKKRQADWFAKFR